MYLPNADFSVLRAITLGGATRWEDLPDLVAGPGVAELSLYDLLKDVNAVESQAPDWGRGGQAGYMLRKDALKLADKHRT